MKKTVVFLLILTLCTTLFSPFSVLAADEIFCQPNLSYNLNISAVDLATASTDYGTGYYTDTTSGNRNIYFDIDDGIINGNTELKNVIVTIEYLDTGEEDKYFAFEYDAQSGVKKRAEQYAEMANANTKKTITYRLEDAYFGNRYSKNSDFAILMPKMQTVFFYKISVEILDEISGIDISATSNNFGNIFFNDSSKNIEIVYNSFHAENLNLDVTYSIVKEFESDNLIYTTQKSVKLYAEKQLHDTFKIPLSVSDYSTYILNVEAKNTEKNIMATAKIPFSVCQSVPEGEANEQLGVGAHFNWGGERDTKSSIELLKKTGFTNIREGYSWPAFEIVADGQRSYEEIDVCKEYIDTAYENGLKTVVMAGYSNVDVLNTIPEEVAAAEENEQTIDLHYIPVTEKGRKAYIDYILELLKMYDGKIDTVEIWNEPNLKSYSSNTYEVDNVIHYANLLKASYTAIKDKYPTVKVAGPVISSVTNYALDWLNAFLEVEDIHNYYDVFSFHSYNFKGNNLDSLLSYWSAIKNRIPEEKEMIVTEFGAPCDISDEDKDYEYQASGLVRYYLTMDVNSIADRYYIYQLSHENTRYESYGMLRYHNAKYPYTAKPSFLAIANMNKQIRGADPVSYDSSDSIVRKLEYKNELRDTTTYVFFSSSDDTSSYTMADSGKKTEFFDMYGNKLNIALQNAKYVIDVSREPLYMVVYNSEDVEVSAIKHDDEITLSGISRISDISDAVALKVFDKDGNLIYINQTNIDKNLNFEFDFIPMSQSDVYTINLGNKSFDKIFELTLTEDEIKAVNLTLLSDEVAVTTYSEFVAKDKLTVNASFKDSLLTDSFNVVIGYYKNKALVKSKIVKNTDMTKNENTYTYDLTEKEQSADTVKIFLVDSFNNLKPLTQSVELE